MLKDLKFTVRKVVETNNTVCFHIFCLEDITFYENDSIKTCALGSKMTYCDQFELMFSQGKVSNKDLKDTTLTHLNWRGGP